MITIKEYIDAKGRNPYAKWFNRLNAPAAAKILWKEYKRRKRQES
jgi:hypothetical protein